MGRKPDREGIQPTEAQLAHQALPPGSALRAANDGGPGEADALREICQGVWQAGFLDAVADFFNAPAVDEVDLSGYTSVAGDAIVVRAHDDF